MKTYKLKTLRELYRVDNKYWKTGDVDILDKRLRLAQEIDSEYWSEIQAITALTTRNHKPFNTLVEALRLYGYEGESAIIEAEEGEAHEQN